ncbi:MBL fold metallo-hydrolase [Effusibacillus lacus]|uniref:Hydrolase glyoxylase n=1 Tax=Effusibacillus lacus TaxID=1348429 RepID=A0A292YMF0_9BACL|nr:MBL fold metallo-hydrolase [Effusibacillus lacus]TCS71413.1 glyoxylase-like metal-dependent hydrolase (beta-lactamase superfamily II) [Effusibacillus lacus]GAX89943.1 hydrolase glyoxylase [Effusibacillus lacus]
MPQTVQLQRPCKGVVSIAIPTPYAIGDVNVYLLEGETLTLVDTGNYTKEAWNALVKGIEAAGYRVTDLKQVVLTHFHEDHTGLAHRLKERTGATVLSHPDTAIWLREEADFMEWRTRFFQEMYGRAGLTREQIYQIHEKYLYWRKYGHSCEVDQTLNDGDQLPALPEWRVLYTPGHSHTHLSLYRESDQTMLLGDHLIAHISSNAFMEPTVRSGEGRVKSLIRYWAELQKLKAIPIRIGLSGHGVPITDHVSLIERRYGSILRRCNQIAGLLADGEQNTLQLALRLFPNHQNQMALILSETLGHLDWLEAEGRIHKISRSGVDWYSV